MKINKIQLLGPFNSGTNLLAKILKQNIKQNIKINSVGHTLFWKHKINKLFIEEQIKLNKDTIFICVYKPLHNWICSMQKKPYDLKWDKTLTNKCIFENRVLKKEYRNIILMYNEYYNMYIDLINNYKRVIFMNYYDIIDKEKSRKYINKKLYMFNLSIKRNNNILYILENPSKKHGKSVKSSNEALSKKEKCYNYINSCAENKLVIKEYFNYKIKKFFED